MNPKVKWGIWVANTVMEDKCFPQWYGQGHPWHLYESKEQAEKQVIELVSLFKRSKYSARKYAKRSL